MAAMQKLNESDVEIIRLSDEYLDAWRTAGRQWTEEKGGDNEWVRRISQSYYGFLEAWEENMQYTLVDQQR